MKKYFRFLPFLLLSFCVVLNSCSEENMNEEYVADDKLEIVSKNNTFQYVYKSETISTFDLGNEKGIATPENAKEDLLHVSFHTDLYLPQQNNFDLENYLFENVEEVNGVLEIYDNNVLIRTDIIQSGVVVESDCENPHDRHCDDDYPGMDECSYEGLRQCVRHNLFEASVVSRLICSFGFYACAAEELATCIETNCVN